jgi:hypothetical protein
MDRKAYLFTLVHVTTEIKPVHRISPICSLRFVDRDAHPGPLFYRFARTTLPSTSVTLTTNIDASGFEATYGAQFGQEDS